MQLSEELALSYYKSIADINAPHHVWLVQHVDTGKLYVKKQLTVYNFEVFRSFKENPVNNIPQIYELVEDNGVLTIIEEYIHGESVQSLLDKQGNFSEEQALDLTLQLCAIVSELHHRIPPIIHRDIKPSNLILTSDGILKLLDFNAAKNPSPVQNRDTRLLGTTGYAAPEQYGFGASTVQTDLYTIGILLNVLLTGVEPYEQHAAGCFSNIITKCTMLDPGERYANIDELISALYEVANTKPDNATKSDIRRVRYDSQNEFTIQQYLQKNSFHNMKSNSRNLLHREEYIHTEQSVHSGKNVQLENRTNLNQNSQKDVKNKRRFLPPGFRSGSPFHILIALIGYGLIISCAVTTKFESVNEADLLLNQIWFALTGVAVVLFSCNYLDILTRLPLTRSNNRVTRILGIILYDILLALALILLLVIVESIIFPQ